MYSDNELIDRLIAERGIDGKVVLGKRSAPDGRETWMLDRAILLPSHTTLILDDCTLKLSDACRDNFIRSANCGIGIEAPERISDLTVKGIGNATLIGADHPRSTGDGSKKNFVPCPFEDRDLIALAPWVSEREKETGILDFATKHDYSYGTNYNKDADHGDWRNIGILFANVDGFRIEGIRIVESHAWAISLESCTHGKISHIDFEAHMRRVIDGMPQNIENQDGIDLRNGCSYIDISDITGSTGDDVIALTAIKDSDKKQGGVLGRTHILPNDWEVRESGIHDVTIRNVKARSSICWVVRLLPCNTRIENVFIENITDTNPDLHKSALIIGLTPNSMYGTVLPDSVKNVVIRHVEGNHRFPVDVQGYLCDSEISDVTSTYADYTPVMAHFEGALKNVTIRPAAE